MCNWSHSAVLQKLIQHYKSPILQQRFFQKDSASKATSIASPNDNLDSASALTFPNIETPQE